MINYSPEMLTLLESYVGRRVTLAELEDGLYPYLEMTVYHDCRADWELSGEVLACIYEVMDGVMEGKTFHDIIQEFLVDPPVLRHRTAMNRRRRDVFMFRQGHIYRLRAGRKPNSFPRTRTRYFASNRSPRTSKTHPVSVTRGRPVVSR
jgi:hypothetical protein